MRRLAVEIRNGCDYPPLLIFPQFRKDRQRQCLCGGPLGFWKVAGLVAQVLEALLKMQWYWVVDFAADSAFRKEGPQLIAAVGADYILVVDVEGFRSSLQQSDRGLRLDGCGIFFD